MFRIGKKADIFDFWTIYLLLLLFSGYYFCENATIVAIVVATGLLVLRTKGSITFRCRTMKVFILMSINIVITEYVASFLYQGESFPLKLLAMTLISLALALCLANSMDAEIFKKSFVSCMIVISGVSVAAYLIYQIVPSMFQMFPALANTNGRVGHFVVFTIVSDFSMTGAQRNQGIFWEPGAFQTFLVLAYMFELTSKEHKTRKWALALFLAAIITTRSTTGIIAGGLLFIYTISRYRGKMSALRVTVAMLCAIVAAALILPRLTGFWEYTLVRKLSLILQYRPGISNQASSRMDSVIYPLWEFLKSPVLGIGTSGYESIAEKVGHSMFTCTPVNWLVEYGIFYGVALFYGVWKFFRNCICAVSDAVILFFIFLLSIATEAFELNIFLLTMCFWGYVPKNYDWQVVKRYEHRNAQFL